MKRSKLAVRGAHVVGLNLGNDAPPMPHTIDFRVPSTSEMDFHVTPTHGLVTGQVFKGNIAARTFHHVSALIRMPPFVGCQQASRWGNTTKKSIGDGGDGFTLQSAKFVAGGP